MIKQVSFVCRFLVLCALVRMLCAPSTGMATQGNFWYGIYNVQHGGTSGDTIFAAMRDLYHMNWALTTINEQDKQNHDLDSAGAHGVKIMQWAVRERGPDEPDTLWTDSALIFWVYSGAAHLVFQAEGGVNPKVS